jgi:DNA-binding NarL/FixJ family response regulator
VNQPEEKIRVMIADDHPIFRESLRLLLEKGGCEIVAEVGTGEEAIIAAQRHKPRVALIDLEMPGIGGLAAARRIGKMVPATRVLMLSAHDDEEPVLEALTQAGAAGYILKSDAPTELLEGVRATSAGRRYLSPSVAPILLSRIQNPRGTAGPELTAREREVLRLVGQGATSKDIAQRLRISPKTAQAHRDNLKQKLNLRSTAEMVHYAIKHKILKLN